jgi:alpha-1,6-mannosyltransferase
MGTVPSVIAGIRFNGPIFLAIAAMTAAPVAAAFAVLAGLAAACWARWNLDVSDAAAWAWPMGIALLCAPVIYPWYLLYFTPFLISVATLPLIAWTVSVIPVYTVWHFSRLGGRWIVPSTVMIVEFAVLIVAVAVVFARRVPPDHQPRAPLNPSPS